MLGDARVHVHARITAAGTLITPGEIGANARVDTSQRVREVIVVVAVVVVASPSLFGMVELTGRPRLYDFRRHSSDQFRNKTH